MKTNQPVNQPAADTSSAHHSNDKFTQLYRQYIGKVFQTYLSTTNDDLAAQDYTLDSLLKNFEKRSTF